jgi:CheY-like chemotaxis protein
VPVAGKVRTACAFCCGAAAGTATARVATIDKPIPVRTSDGYEFIRRVRRSTDRAVRDVPAAALTAYARTEDRRNALQSGFQMHLPKPVDPAELIVAVASLAKHSPNRPR